MGEYHDLYLRSDVLLLTNVFENFRRASLLNYGLDPCHYYMMIRTNGSHLMIQCCIILKTVKIMGVV